MITREQALALWQNDPAAAAHLLQQMSVERDQFKAELTSLKTEYEKLKQQVAKNSRNSSKPPSSDGYAKPAPKTRRKSGQRKSGGQKGHRGHTLQMVDNADHSERHEVLTCAAAAMSASRRRIHWKNGRCSISRNRSSR